MNAALENSLEVLKKSLFSFLLIAMSFSSSCSSDSDSEDTCSHWNLEDYTSSLDESSDSEEKPEDDERVILIFYETLLPNLMRKFSVTNSQVTLSIKHLKDNYKKVSRGRLPSEIDYNDVKYCLGYLHCYAPCHTFLVTEVVSTILRESSVLNELLSKQTLNVVFLGGGPGNDFVGFLIALHGKHEEIFDLDVTIVDKMSGWENVFNETILQLRQEACGKAGYVFDDVNVSSTFITADLKEAEGWGDELETKLRNADVVFIVKALSHIPDEDKLNVIQNILNNIGWKTLLIYIDYPFPFGIFHDPRLFLREVYLSYKERYHFKYSYPAYGCSNITTCRALTRIFQRR